MLALLMYNMTGLEPSSKATLSKHLYFLVS
jgi:hypothetical protein